MREKFERVTEEEVREGEYPFTFSEEAENSAGVEPVTYSTKFKKYTAVSEDRLEQKLDREAREFVRKSDVDPEEDFEGYEIVRKGHRVRGGRHYIDVGFVILDE